VEVSALFRVRRGLWLVSTAGAVVRAARPYVDLSP